MSSIRIRQRRPNDLAECARVLSLVYENDGYPVNWPANVSNFLAPADELAAWVAVDDTDTVIGNLVLSTGGTECRELADIGQPVDIAVAGVSRFFVAPGSQGMGAGAALLEVASAAAAARERELILSVVDTGDQAAVKIYEHLGWRLIATLPLDWQTDNAEPFVMRYYRLP